MQTKTKLQSAKQEKNDEFYTRIEDIEKEMKHYKEQFNGKVIFLNCDDPEWSNFWKYFKAKFNEFNIKKLISTHYGKKSYKLEIVDNVETKTFLEGNGDFRSEECIELLKNSDIIITNPPFSLFREYIKLILEHKKNFLIIGNLNALSYKDFFPLIHNNKIWIGQTGRVSSFFTNKQNTNDSIKKIPSIWYTNLYNERRNKKLDLFKTYNENEYPKYDNYDAIEVSKTREIPIDYNGVMGVPITFIEVFNPKQFEIIKLVAGSSENPKARINGKDCYARVFIKRK